MYAWMQKYINKIQVILLIRLNITRR